MATLRRWRRVHPARAAVAAAGGRRRLRDELAQPRAAAGAGRVLRGVDRRVGRHRGPRGLRLRPGRRHGGGRRRARPGAPGGRRGPAGHPVRRPVAPREGARGRLRRPVRLHRPGRLGRVRRRAGADRLRPGDGVVGRRRALPAGALRAAAVAVRHPARARGRQRRARGARLGRDAGRPGPQRGPARHRRPGPGARRGGRRVGLGRLC